MKKENFKKTALILGLILAGQGTAFADFNIYADPNVVAKKIIKQDKSSFKQIGGSLEKANVVNAGSGPLSIAIDHIIPKSWDIRLTPGIGLENSIVKWKGNVTWPYALENLSLNNDMDVVVNWERRYVTIDSRLRKSNLELSNMKKIASNTNIESEKLNKLSTPSLLEKSDDNITIEKNTPNLLGVSDKEGVIDLENKDGKLNLLSVAKKPLGKVEDTDNKTSSIALLESHENTKEAAEIKIAEMTPKERYEMEKAYKESNVLPMDSTFKGFVKNKDVKNHEYMKLTFVLKAGLSLQDNIRNWVDSMPNNWTLQWDAEKDFMIDKDIRIKNTFIDVFPVVENFYKDSKYPLKVFVYLKNNTVHIYSKELKINHKGAN